MARLVSMVEDGSPQLREVMAALMPHAGHAQVVGITGSPGVGKSTATSALVTELRKADKRVGVLAVDPSSPFSGGALLGDRVRMQDHATDPGVYIRSMASRGHLGGLSWTTPQALRVLDAAGCDVVIVETVGVGQSEVEIAGLADTTLVLMAPGPRRRHPGGQGRDPRDRRRLRRQQGRPRRRRAGTPRAALDGRAGRPARAAAGSRRSCSPSPSPVAASTRWSPSSTGTAPGWRRAASSRRRRTRRARDEIEAIAVAALRERWESVGGHDDLDALAEAVVAGEKDPYAAADELVAQPAPAEPPRRGRPGRNAAATATATVVATR